MKVHYLKCIPNLFDKMVQGIKKFEYRRNDRDFQPGDQLIEREYILIKDLFLDGKEKSGIYTGRTVTVQVLRVWTEIPELPKGFCIMEITYPQTSYFIDPKIEFSLEDGLYIQP